MKRFPHLLSMAVALAMGVTSLAPAADPPTKEQLQKQLATMRQRVAELEARKGDVWLNQRRAEEVKALVRDVLADADTRASLLQEGATAGHNGKHFFLASQDGSFLMNISGQIQFRYIWNSRNSNSDDPINDENESGFELRRTKLAFSGHVGSPRFTYMVRLAVDRNDNSVGADTILIGYELMDGVKLWGGETKAPFLREELTSSAHQLAVERSLLNEIFTTGYVQGIGVDATMGDMVKLAFSVNDGTRSGEVGGQNENGEDIKPFNQDNTDFAITARADVKIAGDWAQMSDFTAWAGEPMGIFVGGAIHYEKTETGGGPVPLSDEFWEWTVDGSVEMNGINVYAAVIGSQGAFGNNIDPWGFLVQGGYNINDQIEPFIRYEYIDLDLPSSSGVDDEIQLVTFGANYYFNKHASKFTLDLVWALDPIPGSGVTGASTTGLGLLPDSATEDDQFALRAQFQLLF